VDALLAAGLTVLVISPNRVRGLRSRYGSAGNKDDWFDAFVLADTVLADTVRTDRARLRPLSVDSAATVTLRMTVRARKDPVAAWSRPGSRWPTSCARTYRPPCRARSGCSGTSAHPPMQQRVLSYEPVPCRGLTRLRMATSADPPDATVPVLLSPDSV
jgi:Transposase